MKTAIIFREALPSEFEAVGQLMIDVYSQLEGFPSKQEMPDYYEMLANVGNFTEKPETKIIVALSSDNTLCGGVVYFANIKDYAAGGKDMQINNASGIRLLAVNSKARGMGVGKGLTRACIQLTLDNNHMQVILHSIRIIKVAWAMYESMGFQRSTDLNFKIHDLSIFGFRLDIRQKDTA